MTERVEGQLTASEYHEVEHAFMNFALAHIGIHPHGFQVGFCRAIHKPTGKKRIIVVLHHKGEAGFAVMPLFYYIQNGPDSHEAMGEWMLPDGRGGYEDAGQTVTGAEYMLLNQPVKGDPS